MRGAPERTRRCFEEVSNTPIVEFYAVTSRMRDRTIANARRNTAEAVAMLRIIAIMEAHDVPKTLWLPDSSRQRP